MSSQTGRPTVIKLKISRRSTCRGAETASWSRQLATTVGLSTSSTLRPGLSSTKSTPAASPMPLPFRPCKKISSPFPCAATTSRYLTSGPASDRSSVSTAPSVAWLFARMALNSSRVRICHSFPALKKKNYFFFRYSNEEKDPPVQSRGCQTAAKLVRPLRPTQLGQSSN